MPRHLKRKWLSAGSEGSTEIDNNYKYGGSDNADNSGVLKYVKLLYTGARSNADIYQDIKDFIFVFQLGLNETMNDSLAICQENFGTLWGQKLVNTLRALHDVKYNQEEEEEEGFYEPSDDNDCCEEDGCHCHDDDCHCHEDGCHCHDDELK